MLPKQINPTRPEDTALAPYNFVPLNDTLVKVDPDTLPDQDAYHAGRLHGTIECVLTTETPLYVRAPLTRDEFYRLQDTEAEKNATYQKRVKNKPDFFYTDAARTPLIPGSTLRGMLRGLMEIVTHGKFTRVTRQPLVYRSVGDTTSHGETYRDRIMQFDGAGYDEKNKRYQRYTPRVSAGYIFHDDGRWWLQPAQSIGGVSYARIHFSEIPKAGPLEPVPGCKNASYIYVKPGPWEYQMIRGGLIHIRYSKVLRAAAEPQPGLVKGVLARSGEIHSKRFEGVVFPPDPNVPRIPVREELAILYLDQVSQEQANLLGRDGVLTQSDKKEGTAFAEDGLPNHRQPVFYLLDDSGELVFFGHTLMMRLPYLHAPYDFVPPTLRDDATIDMVDAVFGYTGDQGQGKVRAYAGRLFVGDAVLVDAAEKDVWWSADPITPRILATPKPTAFQQYLVQQYPDPEEIGRTRDDRPKYQKHLADYTADTPDDTVLRGYKLYWHKGNGVTLNDVAVPEQQAKEHNSQYTQMRPVKPGVSFKFKVYFENLSAAELGALLWVLRLPGSESGAYRHKLGMGKPYGLGSVRLEPSLLLQDRGLRYQTLFAGAKQGLAWQNGERDLRHGEAIEDQIAAFERYMADWLNLPAGATFGEQKRIQALLKLLAWPGPNPSKTRYLEIEHLEYNERRGKEEKVNEYKDRKVLPTPVAEAAAPPPRPRRRPAPRAAATTSTMSPRGSATPSAASAALVSGIMEALAGGPPAQPTAKSEAPALARPNKKEDVTLGMYLEGKVVRVGPDHVVIDLGVDEATLLQGEIVPPVRDRADMAERYRSGNTVKAFVLRISSKGRIQLSMRKPKP
jgi:CRISPR-associated protein (TIGR03986 family)